MSKEVGSIPKGVDPEKAEEKDFTAAEETEETEETE